MKEREDDDQRTDEPPALGTIPAAAAASEIAPAMAGATLTEGPVGRVLAGLAAPMVLGLFSVISFNLTDTYFVSQLGTRELAAMSFTFPVVSVMFGIAMGLGTGTISVVSRAIGAGEQARVRRISSDSLMLSFLTVLVAAGLGMVTIDPLFRALGATDDVLPLIREYMMIWYPGMVFLVVPMVANASIRAAGDTRLPALIMTGGTLINFVLDPLLIFGLLGFPRWELKGAAVATVIGRFLILVASLAILHFRKRMLDFSPPGLRDVLQSWRQVAGLAIAATATNIMPSVAVAFVTRLVAAYGEGAVAAWGAGSRVSHFVLIPVFALGSGLVPFVGQNWGAERYDRVRQARRYAYRFAFFWGLAMVAVLHFGAQAIAGVFSDDGAVVGKIVDYLWIVPLGYGMMGVFFMTEETLNAIGRPAVATATTAIHMFVLYAPLAYAGTWFGNMTGLLAGVAAADIAAGFIGVVFVHRLCHRREATCVL